VCPAYCKEKSGIQNKNGPYFLLANCNFSLRKRISYFEFCSLSILLGKFCLLALCWLKNNMQTAQFFPQGVAISASYNIFLPVKIMWALSLFHLCPGFWLFSSGTFRFLRFSCP
jgi:hypothetical protein